MIILKRGVCAQLTINRFYVLVLPYTRDSRNQEPSQVKQVISPFITIRPLSV